MGNDVSQKFSKVGPGLRRDHSGSLKNEQRIYTSTTKFPNWVEMTLLDLLSCVFLLELFFNERRKLSSENLSIYRLSTTLM